MLPQKLPLDLMQTKWAQELNPVIANPILQNNILKNISLVSGANVVNHKLGRNLVGWQIIRQRSAASFFDTQDTNQTPELTLNLNASAPVIVDLVVF